MSVSIKQWARYKIFYTKVKNPTDIDHELIVYDEHEFTDKSRIVYSQREV